MRFIAGACSSRKSKKATAYTFRALRNRAMDAYDPKSWKLGQAEFPRRVLVRARLEQARKESDTELKRLARSPRATDSTQAYDLIKVFAIGAPPTTTAVSQCELLALDLRISKKKLLGIIMKSFWRELQSAPQNSRFLVAVLCALRKSAFSQCL